MSYRVRNFVLSICRGSCVSSRFMNCTSTSSLYSLRRIYFLFDFQVDRQVRQNYRSRNKMNLSIYLPLHGLFFFPRMISMVFIFRSVQIKLIKANRPTVRLKICTNVRHASGNSVFSLREISIHLACVTRLNRTSK